MLADALFHIYSIVSPGTVRAHSEYAYLDAGNDTSAVCECSENRSIPMHVELEARVVMCQRLRTESSCDSAKWIRSHFVLHSPQERKEGRSTTKSAESSTAEPENSPVASNEPQLVVMMTTKSEEGSTHSWKETILRNAELM